MNISRQETSLRPTIIREHRLHRYPSVFFCPRFFWGHLPFSKKVDASYTKGKLSRKKASLKVIILFCINKHCVIKQLCRAVHYCAVVSSKAFWEFCKISVQGLVNAVQITAERADVIGSYVLLYFF